MRLLQTIYGEVLDLLYLLRCYRAAQVYPPLDLGILRLKEFHELHLPRGWWIARMTSGRVYAYTDLRAVDWHILRHTLLPRRLRSWLAERGRIEEVDFPHLRLF